MNGALPWYKASVVFDLVKFCELERKRVSCTRIRGTMAQNVTKLVLGTLREHDGGCKEPADQSERSALRPDDGQNVDEEHR